MTAFDKGTVQEFHFAMHRQVTTDLWRRLRNALRTPPRLRRQVLFVLLSLCLLTCTLPVSAQSQAARPKLVVLIVADQFSYSYLSRYQDRFAAGGFRLLQDKAANFTLCRLGTANSQSACGHSIISTGAYPWATGIIGDQWYNRSAGKLAGAVSDDTASAAGGNVNATSLRWMQGTTIGDQMKLASNGRSKVITVSIKPDDALLLAGRLASDAFFWDMKTGNFVTSAQYGHETPAWVQSFNDGHYADKFLSKQWQRLLPETQYGASTRDDYPYERAVIGDGRQFPHVVTGGASVVGEPFYNAFAMTPSANQMICDFAREAVEKEALGQHSEPDLLGISLSAGDALGQAFGPYSQEVEDLCLRMDESLSSLFQYLDQKVGLDNCLIAFTSDHGVMPIPEFLKERGLDAGRIDPKAFKTLLDAALDARLGQGDWIESFEPPNIYLSSATVKKAGYKKVEVEGLAANMAQAIPGVAEVYTEAELFLNQNHSGPLATAVSRSYCRGRSGDFVVIPKPGYIFLGETSGTTTGSPYNYDCQVPLFLMGGTIRPGRYTQPVSSADIAPTIASALGIEAPSLSEGRPIAECLQSVSSGRSRVGETAGLPIVEKAATPEPELGPY